ncbi:unnamed protein product [Protopolystoma xenopodis]|uniref:C2 domain-containing protein n=1 Tax=Protopolystoma xenopodis TaxID=117903 RepID=A0A448WVH9_9PLAT|nr:unnamed protein product [Protopolystoma xenopodis]
MAADETGFSDPFARILICNEVLQTLPIYETMSPMWDVMLYREVTFNYSSEAVKANHQQIILEIFDVDNEVGMRLTPIPRHSFSS